MPGYPSLSPLGHRRPGLSYGRLGLNGNQQSSSTVGPPPPGHSPASAFLGVWDSGAQQGAGLDMQDQCAEIKLRAERRAGEMLAEMDKNKGAQGVGVPSHDVTAPTLADLGLSKMQSSRWQAEATVPEELFERHVAETKAASQRRLGITDDSHDVMFCHVLAGSRDRWRDCRKRTPKSCFAVTLATCIHIPMGPPEGGCGFTWHPKQPNPLETCLRESVTLYLRTLRATVPRQIL